jgi:hypothetical protein
MFDFRYHALSIASVFLALTIGLLLGIAIGDAGLVSSAGSDVRKSLRADVTEARAESARLRAELRQRERFEADLYPLLVGDRLAGRRVGLIGLGGLDDGTIRYVREALKDSGGQLAGIAVVRQPVSTDAIPPEPAARGGGTAKTTTTTTTPSTAPAVSDAEAAKRFGVRVGIGLVNRGTFIRRIRRDLLESSSGRIDGFDAVVLVRKPFKGDAEEVAVTDAFNDGLVTGLTRDDTPVVGAEQTTTTPSQIPWYTDHRLASVDNIDQLPGRVALVFTLNGAGGAYGVKDTAQALLPKAATG